MMSQAKKSITRGRKRLILSLCWVRPGFEKLPEKFKSLEFPQFEFNKWIIEETNELAAPKLNVASYEAKGAKGWQELEKTMDYLKEKYSDIFTICDAKRADIGYTRNFMLGRF